MLYYEKRTFVRKKEIGVVGMQSEENKRNSDISILTAKLILCAENGDIVCVQNSNQNLCGNFTVSLNKVEVDDEHIQITGDPCSLTVGLNIKSIKLIADNVFELLYFNGDSIIFDFL